jgi:hypothetical protein
MQLDEVSKESKGSEIQLHVFVNIHIFEQNYENLEFLFSLLIIQSACPFILVSDVIVVVDNGTCFRL